MLVSEKVVQISPLLLWKEYDSMTTIQQITKFFLCLLKEIGSVFAIKGYRAALSHIFALAGTDHCYRSHTPGSLCKYTD